MKTKLLSKKRLWILLSKRILLFLAIFSAGSLVSGFYFQRHSKPTLNVYGFPSLEQKGYTLVYDGRAKVPLWTYEHLTRKKLEAKVKRNQMHFYENYKIYPLHRSTLSDYYQSGYDRGHMVPAADQQFEKEALRETFLLSNICPQNAELNRGYWAKLEKHARKLALENESVDVVTGPLYLPEMQEGKKMVQYQVIGPNNVSVPTHFYKVIQINRAKQKPQVSAYIVPNISVANQTPLNQYQVSLEEVEKASGLVFENFPKRGSSLKMKIEASI